MVIKYIFLLGKAKIQNQLSFQLVDVPGREKKQIFPDDLVLAAAVGKSRWPRHLLLNMLHYIKQKLGNLIYLIQLIVLHFNYLLLLWPRKEEETNDMRWRYGMLIFLLAQIRGISFVHTWDLKVKIGCVVVDNMYIKSLTYS